MPAGRSRQLSNRFPMASFDRAASGDARNMAGKSELVRVLLDRYGTTYAEEAGIRLADKPSPLYRLLVLALLLSARIASPLVTMRQTSSAVTGLIAFASTTCPAKPAIDVAVSPA